MITHTQTWRALPRRLVFLTLHKVFQDVEQSARQTYNTRCAFAGTAHSAATFRMEWYLNWFLRLQLHDKFILGSKWPTSFRSQVRHISQLIALTDWFDWCTWNWFMANVWKSVRSRRLWTRSHFLQSFHWTHFFLWRGATWELANADSQQWKF